MNQALLVTHYNPVIHGQAAQAALLLEAASTWKEVKVNALNTVYADERADLKGFSFLKIKKVLGYSWQLIRKLRKENYSTVIITPAFFLGPLIKDSFFIWLVRIFSNARLIAWVHMDPARLEYERRPVILRAYLDQTFKQIAEFVCCAPNLKKSWPSYLQCYNIAPLPNGVPDTTNEQLATPGARERLRVIYLSAIDPEKGWRELFRTAEKICQRQPLVDFYFYGPIGANENEEQVREMFVSSEYPERIKLCGGVWHEDKNDAYRNADVFCFPSHTEAFPITILEAMSFGLPIISSDVGAVSDALIMPEGGYLLEAGNEKKLELALSNLVSDPSKLDAMGMHNRERYLKFFCQAAFSEAWKRKLLAPTQPT